MSEFLEKIKKLYVFEWFEENFLQKIINQSQIENFSKWDEIILEWEKSWKAFVIISGIVSIIKNWKNINTLFEWDIFWEISLVTNEKRTATVKAETDIKVLTFYKNTLLEIINTLPNWELIKNTILNRIIMNNKINHE